MEKPDFNPPTIGINDLKEFLREYEVDRVGVEFRNRVVTLTIASLGLITALAWDETLRALFHQLFGDSESLGAHALYALVITVLAVLISYTLSKIIRPAKTEEKK